MLQIAVKYGALCSTQFAVLFFKQAMLKTAYYVPFLQNIEVSGIVVCYFNHCSLSEGNTSLLFTKYFTVCSVYCLLYYYFTVMYYYAFPDECFKHCHIRLHV